MRRIALQKEGSDALEIKRQKKAAYMKKYYEKQKAANKKRVDQVVNTEPATEPTEKATKDLPARERIYGPVIDALTAERETMLVRHAAELREIDQGLAVLTRLARREQMRPAKGTKVYKLTPK